MNSAEYIAVAAGLISVWQGVSAVKKAFQIHEQAVIWTLAIPF
ncbi:MAG: hypothetical protein RI539_04930 [Spiribacter sp.]|jgi:hypothetical protein|nr:hypothetical protein [Spiribacter sp.]MDR9489674.1 hypothetical protein [Spiribacter sp.]